MRPLGSSAHRWPAHAKLACLGGAVGMRRVHCRAVLASLVALASFSGGAFAACTITVGVQVLASAGSVCDVTGMGSFVAPAGQNAGQASGAGSEIIANGNSFSASGVTTAIEVFTVGATVSLTNTSVTETGANGIGVGVLGGTATLSGGSVSASGNQAYAIGTLNGGSVTANGTTISASGGAVGVGAFQNTAVSLTGGSVSATGPFSAAIVIDSGSLVTLAGGVKILSAPCT
jgi:hypothetical protein